MTNQPTEQNGTKVTKTFRVNLDTRQSDQSNLLDEIKSAFNIRGLDTGLYIKKAPGKDSLP